MSRGVRISDKCNFREIERARFARCGEHGSNTGAWERAGKTAAGSAQARDNRSAGRREGSLPGGSPKGAAAGTRRGNRERASQSAVACYSASVPVALAFDVAASLC